MQYWIELKSVSVMKPDISYKNFCMSQHDLMRSRANREQSRKMGHFHLTCQVKEEMIRICLYFITYVSSLKVCQEERIKEIVFIHMFVSFLG